MFAAGARVNGPWIHGATWDATQKFAVQGNVVWPQAKFQIVTGAVNRAVMRLLQGNVGWELCWAQSGTGEATTARRFDTFRDAKAWLATADGLAWLDQLPRAEEAS